VEEVMGFGGAQRLLVLALLSASPLVLEAQSTLGFLKDAPAGHFNKKDWDLLKDAMRAALAAQESDNTPKVWQNTDNGHSGKVTTIKRYTSDGKDCRRLQFENQADGRTNRSRYELCREADGSWREVSSGATFVSLVRTR
jgi:surface antigen